MSRIHAYPNLIHLSKNAVNGLGTEFHGQHKVSTCAQQVVKGMNWRYITITAYACTPGSYQLTGWVKDAAAPPSTSIAKADNLAVAYRISPTNFVGDRSGFCQDVVDVDVLTGMYAVASSIA